MTEERHTNRLNANDLAILKRLDISEADINAQVEMFKRGSTPVQLVQAATVGNGMIHLSKEEENDFMKHYSEQAGKYRIIKFVPASGAATRMFKTLLHFNNSYDKIDEIAISQKAITGDKDCKALLEVLQGLRQKQFAFHYDLQMVMARDGFDLNALICAGNFKPVLDYLLTEKGLNYGILPKGLIKFHKYEDHCRTAIEEHLVEGSEYATDPSGKVHIHFTIAPEFKETFQSYIKQIISQYEQNGTSFDIEYSEQKPHTDRIAVSEDNTLFRDTTGNLVLRAGGHGALIENLNELKTDIIFIKNIDNLVPDRLKPETIRYKKILAGYLIKLQTQIFQTLLQLENHPITQSKINSIYQFAKHDLSIYFPDDFSHWNQSQQRRFLFNRLNRPLRVCGMVKNEGEPGGGPFLVKNKDGSLSLQIVETAQIDTSSESQRTILNNASHFNPVDLVCAIKDYKGIPFNLLHYIDPNTYFISHKSWNGRYLKALELPGLWNGAMADWITIFVEVPSITFNPIKTINDLLRPEHQND